MKVAITQAHIDKAREVQEVGNQLEIFYCPISQAFQELYPEADGVSSSPLYINVFRNVTAVELREYIANFRPRSKARVGLFMRKFDSKKPVKPQTFIFDEGECDGD